MKKYIDAEKLTKFEETLADIIVSSQGLCTYEACKDMAKREAPILITSLQQEQPEVDLEKEINSFLNAAGAPFFWCSDDEQREWCSIIARHFAEWGAIHLNARKEE